MNTLDNYKKHKQLFNQMAEDFAANYPEIAGKLSLNPGQSADPFIERLIQAFSFLTSSMKSDFENEFQRLQSYKIKTHSPYHNLTLPSMSMIQVIPSKDLQESYSIPKHSVVTIANFKNERFEFRSTCDLDILPFKIMSTKIENGSQSQLVIHLKTTNNAINFQDFHKSSIKFHIIADTNQAAKLQSLLFNSVDSIKIQTQTNSCPLDYSPSYLKLPSASFCEILPYPENVSTAYKTLLESTVYSVAHQYFEIEIDKNLLPEAPANELFININFTKNSLQSYDADILKLNCVPIINLFQNYSEPMLVDHSKLFYPLILDCRYKSCAKVVNIESLSLLEDETTKLKPYQINDVAEPDVLYWNINHSEPWSDINCSLSFHAPEPTMNKRNYNVIANCFCTNNDAVFNEGVNPTTLTIKNANSDLIDSINYLSYQKSQTLDYDFDTPCDLKSYTINSLKDLLTPLHPINPIFSQFTNSLIDVNLEFEIARLKNSIPQSYTQHMKIIITVNQLLPEEITYFVADKLFHYLKVGEDLSKLFDLIIIDQPSKLLFQWLSPELIR